METRGFHYRKIGSPAAVLREVQDLDGEQPIGAGSTVAHSAVAIPSPAPYGTVSFFGAASLILEGKIGDIAQCCKAWRRNNVPLHFGLHSCSGFSTLFSQEPPLSLQPLAA